MERESSLISHRMCWMCLEPIVAIIFNNSTCVFLTHILPSLINPWGFCSQGQKRSSVGQPNHCRQRLKMTKGGHRILRRQAVKHMQSYKAAAQLGGLPGKAVSQAAHILTTWAHWKKMEHRSTAVIFVDVRQAFYRLLRAHLTKPERLDDDVIRLFHTLHLPEDSFQEFATELKDANALKQSGMSDYMEGLKPSFFIVLGSKGRFPMDPRIC